MFKMNQHQITELCGFAHMADREARSDLVLGFITSENDYTSNFTGALRRIINSNSQSGLTATSFKLDGSAEQQYGCDAVIAIVSNGYVKFAYFEAKWPRISQPKYPWDTISAGKSVSRFSSQLERQANSLPSTVAKFEMFYCEKPFNKQPPYMNDDTSSCVWHADAYKLDQGRLAGTPWNDSDLSKLLARPRKPENISDILLDVCECHAGSPIQIFGPIELMAREFRLTCPILAVSADENPEFDIRQR